MIQCPECGLTDFDEHCPRGEGQCHYDRAALDVGRSTPERVKILQEGAALTFGPRDAEYGPPGLTLLAAGELKSVFRKHVRREMSLAELEAIDMCLTKLSRIANGAPKRDTYVDAATYLAIAGEIALADKKPA